MAKDNSGSWRDRQQGSGAPSKRKTSWRKKQAVTEDSQNWQKSKADRAARNTRRFTGYVALFCISLVVFAAVLYWMTQQRVVPVVMITVADYAHPLPPNVLVDEDRRMLIATWDKYDDVRADPVTDQTNSTDEFLAAIRRRLELTKPGGPPFQKNLALYLNVHGAVNRQGQPCLILPDHQPLDDTTWLPVQDVIKAVQSVRRIRKARKLIVLDTAKLDVQWNMGILYNAFADRLQATVNDADDDTLTVLHCAGPGERAWVAPELGGSVFAFFFARGMRGAADQNGDSKLTIQELHRYLRYSVQDWVQTHRGSQQRPIMIPSDPKRDFSLAMVSGSSTSSPVPYRVSEDQVNTWNELWPSYAAHWEGKLATRQPFVWSQLQMHWQRFEQLLVGGKAYEKEVDAEAGAIRGILNELEAAASPHAPITSLAERNRRHPDEAVTRQDVLNDIEAWREVNKAAEAPPTETPATAEPTPAATEPAGATAEGAPEPAVAAPPAAPTIPYWQAAAVLVSLWQEEDFAWEQLSEQLEYLEATAEPPPQDPVEVYLARLANGFVNQEAAGGSFPTALAVRRKLEEAMVPLDVRSLAAVQAVLRDSSDPKSAHTAVRQNEDRLLLSLVPGLQQANSEWQNLLNHRSPGSISLALDVGDTVSRAYRLRDEIWSALPWLGQWLTRRDGLTAENLEQLLKVVRENHRLAVDLEGFATLPLTPDTLEGLRLRISRHETNYDALYKKYTDRCNFIAKQRSNALEEFGEFSEIMRVPLVAEDRPGLIQIYAEELQKTAEPENKWQGDDPASDDTEYLRLLCSRASHPAVSMLARQPQLFEEPAAAAAADDEVTRSAYLNKLMAWGADTRDQLRSVDNVRRKLSPDADDDASATRDKYAHADRITRPAASLLGKRPWNSAFDDPSARLSRINEHYQCQTQMARRVDDFWGPAPGRGVYFVTACEAYQEASRQLLPRAAAWRRSLNQLYQSRRLAQLYVDAENLRVGTEQQKRDQVVTLEIPENLPPGNATFMLRRPGSLADAQEVVFQPLNRAKRKEVTIAAAETTQVGMELTIEPQMSDEGLEALLFFRGHMGSSLFHVGRAQADVVLSEQPDMSPPQVTVQGKPGKEAQVLFILDCSASMNNDDRMGISKRALKDLFRAMDGGPFKIGLTLYGNRVGIKNGIQHRSPGVGPDHPADDVDPVIPISNQRVIDDQGIEVALKDVLNAAVDKARPYGLTPLYRSIIDSLGTLSSRSGQRYLVVITDGLNYTNVNPRDNPKRITPVSDPGINQLEYALREKDPDISVFVLGFALPDRDLETLKDAITEAGGTFGSADKPEALREQLLSALPPLDFSVISQTTTTRVTERMNRPVPVPNVRPPGLHTVRVQHDKVDIDADVILEGGEALLMEYAAELRQLRHVPYSGTDKRGDGVNVENPLRPTEHYRITGLLPDGRRGSALTFRVLMENSEDYRFTPRPKAVWAEIRPVIGGNIDPNRVFVFNELAFEPGQPVPVLRFPVARWPDNATEAELWLALRMEPPPGGLTLRIDPENFPSKLEQLPEVGLSLETDYVDNNRFLRVMLTEQYPLGQPADDSTARFGIGKFFTVPAAKRARHSFYYDPQDRRVQHTFMLDATAAAPQLRLITKKQMVDRAMIVRKLRVTTTAR